MPQYIAFLRGINVGGNHKVEMPKLKMAFEKMGYTDVSTYINSGNVIFSSTKENFDTIEPFLEKVFKFVIPVIVRSAKNIKNVTKKIPKDWENDKEQKTDILFLWDDYDKKPTINLIDTKEGIDELLYVPGAIIWHIDRDNYKKSAMNKFIGTLVYKNMTARNVNTVRKLSQLLQPAVK